MGFLSVAASLAIFLSQTMAPWPELGNALPTSEKHCEPMVTSLPSLKAVGKLKKVSAPSNPGLAPLGRHLGDPGLVPHGSSWPSLLVWADDTDALLPR